MNSEVASSISVIHSVDLSQQPEDKNSTSTRKICRLDYAILPQSMCEFVFQRSHVVERLSTACSRTALLLLFTDTLTPTGQLHEKTARKKIPSL